MPEFNRLLHCPVMAFSFNFDIPLQTKENGGDDARVDEVKEENQDYVKSPSKPAVSSKPVSIPGRNTITNIDSPFLMAADRCVFMFILPVRCPYDRLPVQYVARF